MTDAWTRGMSRWLMALNTSRPTPGHAKIVSTTTTPDRRKPNSRPNIVTTGSHALRSAWLTTTANSLRPLARAVRTKSWLSTSSMDERTRRALRASEKKAIVKPGMIR